MTSAIRLATEEDKQKTITFAEQFKSPIREIVQEAEDYGLRVIFKKNNAKELPILMPSGRVLIWDFNPRSLDSLAERDFTPNSELGTASTYLGIVAEPYLNLQIQHS